ncbi:MAG: molybdopterin-dependent oxidoreductase, partial [Thermodesulfobacteriota bacterium]
MSEDKKGGIKRRDFLKIIGVAGTTAAVASSCSEPVEQIIPYVIPPEGIIPGVPNYYSSTCRECSAGCGIQIKNREGRAIFIEGNLENPINKGSVCSMGQASLQGLYNPDRIRSPLTNINKDRLTPLGWEAAEKALTEKIEEARSNGKTGNIVFLSNNINGALGDLVDDWMQALGGKHIQYETFAHEPLKEANKICFGIDAIPSYQIQNSKYLLSFGADFVETWLSPSEFTRQFTDMHSLEDKSIGRFVHIEPRASMTATNADDWISIKPGTDAVLALGIANQIVSSGNSPNGGGGLSGLLSQYTLDKVSEITDVPQNVITQLADEFGTKGPSLAIGGGAAVTGTNATQTLVAINILNYVAGSIGDTIDFGDTLSISTASSFEDISSLAKSMENAEVDILFIYDVNPVFTLPTQLNFGDALTKVPFVVSFSSFMDETTEHANLIMPNNTPIESWGDYQPRESVHGLIQPAMSPVFNTKGTGDVILSVSGQVEELNGRYEQTTFYDYLRNAWMEKWASDSASSGDFEVFWKEALERGGVYKDLPSKQVSLSPSVANMQFPEAEFIGEGEFYFMAYPSYIFYDGRGANKPWLQELPEAITTGVWSSWVEVHPDTAKKLGVELGDYLSIESPQGVIETQVYIYQGARPDTLSVMIGQGHTSYGRYAKDRGVNPINILPLATDSLSGGFAWLSTKVNAAKVNKKEQFVQLQYTTEQHDRDIAQSVSLVDLLEGNLHDEHHHPEADFYPPREYHKYRWAMNVDLQKCVGCGSCVTACYAENNIAFVGKQMCAQRRDMSWMRIERYFEKADNNAGFSTRYLPMMCQQCGNAPCEPVCPVYATYHNPEGLNGMVYNRCVGTRYCSNNCTYKVRKFNWYTYKWPEPLNWQL